MKNTNVMQEQVPHPPKTLTDVILLLKLPQYKDKDNLEHGDCYIQFWNRDSKVVEDDVLGIEDFWYAEVRIKNKHKPSDNVLFKFWNVGSRIDVRLSEWRPPIVREYSFTKFPTINL